MSEQPRTDAQNMCMVLRSLANCFPDTASGAASRRLHAAASMIEQLECKLTQARKALEPFANEATRIQQDWPDSMRLAVSMKTVSGFTLGDIRRAARAIKSEGGK